MLIAVELRLLGIKVAQSVTELGFFKAAHASRCVRAPDSCPDSLLGELSAA